MPPKGSKKRAADSGASSSKAKSTKTNASTTAGAEAAQEEPNVQGNDSASHSPNEDNSDECHHDHEMTEEKLKQDPHTYIMNCAPRFEFEARYNKEHENDEDFDEEEASDLWAKEHNQRKCACFDKSRTDGWSMMRKAFARKMDAETIEIPHRDPDAFGMYVYNDFAGYGYQEVVENNMAEFNKILNSKDGKTEELWTIMESMVWWIVEEPHAPWHMIDDGERSWLTYSLLGFMFLTALNRIDQEGELKPDSKYKDLSLVISLWARAADDLGEDVEDPLDDSKGKGGDSDLGEYAGFNLLWFRYLLALAKEASIPIKGVSDVDDKVDAWNSQIEGKVTLPPKKADRFGWKTKFQKYTKTYGKGGKIGGQAFQITKWSRAERKKHAFDKKDPLSDDQIKALENGMVLQIM
ncbi:hypothetical protein E4T49_08445 [Aureobasidium sp. EXF-10728]|nr:hypothetical protein E4T49_08445 [Aureobasidium sp. EXF-10728]